MVGMTKAEAIAREEYRRAHVRFVDFNEEEKYVVQEIVDRNHHLMQVRLAARLFDPDAFILGSALLKPAFWRSCWPARK